MTYKVLFDYGSEGFAFLGNTKGGANYATIDEAVKAAISYNSYGDFLIVTIIDWKATT